MFRCRTCRKEIPDGEAVSLNLMVKLGFFAWTLLFARGWNWPVGVCKDCAEDTKRVGELAFFAVAAILAIGVLILVGSR